MSPRRAAEREVWQALRSLLLDGNDRRREASEALGLSFVRVKALRYIANGPIAMRDLAVELATDAPYTTLVVDDLEKRGLAVRAPNPADRRAKIVSATAEGKKAARKAETILGTPPAAMRAFSESELAELGRMVGVLLGESRRHGLPT